MRHHGSSRCVSITSRSGQVIASGDHGSSSRVPVISAIKDPGDRNETPAQTPSPRDPRPNRCESRWDSQRSTPRAGTTTRSSANGSVGGLASSSPSPSARMSVRSARWICKAIDQHPKPTLRQPSPLSPPNPGRHSTLGQTPSNRSLTVVPLNETSMIAASARTCINGMPRPRLSFE